MLLITVAKRCKRIEVFGSHGAIQADNNKPTNTTGSVQEAGAQLMACVKQVGYDQKQMFIVLAMVLYGLLPRLKRGLVQMEPI